MSDVSYTGASDRSAKATAGAEAASQATGTTKLLRIANTASFAVALVANGTAGKGIGEISRRYANDIVPDGWAFAIWGIIYTLLFGFLAFQWTGRGIATVNNIGWAWVVSNLLNGLWVQAFVFKGGAPAAVLSSCPVLFGLLAANIAVLYRVGSWQQHQHRSMLELVFVDVTFSMYAGWCTVASIVNCAAALVSQNGVGEDLGPLTGAQWSVLMMVVAAVVNILVLVNRRDPVFPLVFVWATWAIRTKHAATPLVANTATVLSLTMLSLDAAVCGVRYYRGRGSQPARSPEDASSLLHE